MFILLLVPAFAAAGDIYATDIQTKILEKDNAGDVWYAIKARVGNTGSRDRVVVTLQAIDIDGFEIDSTSLRGNVKPGTAKILTGKTYMSIKDFNRIHKWQLKN